MLILIKWLDTGALLSTTDGRTIFKGIDELTSEYIPFVHHSPKGESQDIQIYVNKTYFD